MPPGGRRSQPPTFVRRRGQTAVEAHPAFRNHEGEPGLNPFVVTFIQLRALVRQDADPDLESGPLQLVDPATSMLRIWIDRADHNLSYSRIDNRIGAWTGPAGSRAGLQGDIQG